MFIPHDYIYGSQYTYVLLVDGIKSYLRRITIRRTLLKSIDQPSQHCAEVTVANTSGCIARYIEANLGCIPRIHGGTTPANPKYCKSPTELEELANISKKMEEADANEIYEITKCLATCNKFKYEVSDPQILPYIGSENWDARFLDIQLIIRDGKFEEREQYLIYDWDSFIADIGGFLGLLLGCSMFSLYQDMVDMVGRVKNKVNTQVS